MRSVIRVATRPTPLGVSSQQTRWRVQNWSSKHWPDKVADGSCQAAHTSAHWLSQRLSATSANESSAMQQLGEFSIGSSVTPPSAVTRDIDHRPERQSPPSGGHVVRIVMHSPTQLGSDSSTDVSHAMPQRSPAGDCAIATTRTLISRPLRAAGPAMNPPLAASCGERVSIWPSVHSMSAKSMNSNDSGTLARCHGRATPGPQYRGARPSPA